MDPFSIERSPLSSEETRPLGGVRQFRLGCLRLPYVRSASLLPILVPVRPRNKGDKEGYPQVHELASGQVGQCCKQRAKRHLTAVFP